MAVIASGGAADETLELHGDAQGTRRVRAALEAHMWPGLTMKRGDGSSTSASVLSESKKEEAGGTTEEEDETPGGPDDDFERMLGEMTRVRAMGANASDSERRAMAADAAMMMMSTATTMPHFAPALITGTETANPIGITVFPC